MTVWQCSSALMLQASSVSLPPITLTIVAPNGTQTVLNQTAIGNLPSYRAYGGYKNQLGVLKGLGNYTGVPINTFCQMVGGLRSGYIVRIIASDGYTTTMKYDQVNGAFVTYDNKTGQQVQHNQTLTPVLAYHYNDLNLSSGDQPLKVAILGSEGLCTDSMYWAKKVVRLEIHITLQPMNLTVFALNGTQLVLHETDIANLEALRAVGAYRNQLGVVKGLGNYTGVPISRFCNLVGGMSSDTVLRATAADGYVKIFTYAEVNGEFTTYDSVTGQLVQHNQTLTPILAYHFNDANLSSSDGPLRTAIIGSEGLATSSSYWVKRVVKLEVRYRDDVAVTAATPLRTLVGHGYSYSVNVTLANQGGYNETLSVTAYANLTAIGVQTFTLSAGNSATIMFAWNTTGFSFGNYTISAKVGTVPDETDTADNNLVDGVAMLTLPGDVNGDLKCDGKDFALIARAFNTKPSDSRWDQRTDINEDSKVDGKDIAITARNLH
jgi:hypothetical protein